MKDKKDPEVTTRSELEYIRNLGTWQENRAKPADRLKLLKTYYKYSLGREDWGKADVAKVLGFLVMEIERLKRGNPGQG